MLVAQIIAVIIFIVMFVVIVLDFIPKEITTITCGFLTLTVVFGICMRSVDAIIETLNYRSIFTLNFWYSGAGEEATSSGINWETIIFLLGMMIMVEGMAESGFFRWLCLRIAKICHFKPMALFVVFMIMSAFLAMFIDSITVILFLAAITIELAMLLKINPLPMIITEIFCANLGGSATMCGDPPNIIIGTSLGYSFVDFLLNTGFIAGIGLIFVIVYYSLYYRKELKSASAVEVDLSKMPKPSSAIKNKREFTISVFIFLTAVVLLVTHAETGLSVATIGVFIAILTLIFFAKKAKILLKKVDYRELLFFIGLFCVVGGLEQTGILVVIADFIGRLSKGSSMIMVTIIIWISAVASALVDNIPFSATMIPIIKTLAAAQGVDLSTLAWALSMGTDIGGSSTPIGASANVVGLSVASRNGYHVGWGKYCKASIPATIIVLSISMIVIYFRYLA